MGHIDLNVNLDINTTTGTRDDNLLIIDEL